MKRWQTIGILAGNVILLAGYVGFIALWYRGFTCQSDPGPGVFLFLFLGLIGQGLFLVFLVLTLVGLYRRNRAMPMPVGRLHITPNGQVVFAALNLYFGGTLFSALPALHAMDLALAAKAEPSEDAARARLRRARSWNLIAVGFVCLQYLLILGFMAYTFIRFFAYSL